MSKKGKFERGRILFPVLAALFVSGCFTARTGEFYQETKAARIEAWWSLVQDEQQFTIFSLVTVPLKLLLQGLDVGVINPLWDTAMTPVDACFPQHGQRFRVVDENGKPISGATVAVEGTYRGDKGVDFTFSKSVQDTGKTDREGFVSISRRHRNYELFDCLITAEGYHPRRVRLYADRTAFTPKADEKGREAITLSIDSVKAPLKTELRTFDIPYAGTHGEQEWVRAYDLVKGDWLPPHGRGVVADMNVSFIGSKEKGTKKTVLMPGASPLAFARLPVKPFCDPRYFVIDYTLPSQAAFETEVCILLEGEDMKHENVLDAVKEYIAYRVRREDGVHVGAFIPTGLGTRMRHLYNPTAGSQTLEYR